MSQLEKLLKQQEALKKKIAAEKQKAKSQERKSDTRRKILIGAVITEEMKKDSQLADKVKNLLSASLVRENDRKLFELPLIEKK